MFGHCRQPSGIAAGSPTCASITPAGNLTLATSSLRSSSSTTPAATTTAPITTAPTLYPHGHLLFVTHAAPAQRDTNAIKTTSKRPSNSRKKTRSPTVVEARATPPSPYDPKAPHHDLDEESEMCHRSVEYWPTATAVH